LGVPGAFWIGRAALASIAATAIGCSLFVSVPDLSGGVVDGGGSVDASIDTRGAEATTPETEPDSSTNDEPPPETDAGCLVPRPDGSTDGLPPYMQAVLADKPLAYWRLGESVGPTACDSSGNGRTGTYVGNITYGQPGAIAGDPATSVVFNGGYMSAGASFAFLEMAPSSLEAWISRPLDGSYHGIMAHDDRNSQAVVDQGYVFLLVPSNVGAPINFSRVNGSSGDYANSWGASWSSGWTHVAATYDGQTVTVFINGASAGSGAATTSIGPVMNAFVVGSDSGGVQDESPFNGSMGEVAVYDHALSQKSLQTHYDVATGMAPP
jgi:Concanavalin A-like lectin/glucanases superfamily